MVAVLQRVTSASVSVDGKIIGKIQNGLLILLGITHTDNQKTIDWLSKKIVGLRIFSDADDKMNLSVKDINGDILLVSQFTLHAKVKKGNRPSFTNSAPPKVAIPLYQEVIKALENQLEKPIETGEFGAMMKIELLNDGPVTICIDTEKYGIN